MWNFGIILKIEKYHNFDQNIAILNMLLHKYFYNVSLICVPQLDFCFPTYGRAMQIASHMPKHIEILIIIFKKSWTLITV